MLGYLINTYRWIEPRCCHSMDWSLNSVYQLWANVWLTVTKQSRKLCILHLKGSKWASEQINLSLVFELQNLGCPSCWYPIKFQQIQLYNLKCLLFPLDYQAAYRIIFFLSALSLRPTSSFSLVASCSAISSLPRPVICYIYEWTTSLRILLFLRKLNLINTTLNIKSQLRPLVICVTSALVGRYWALQVKTGV